MPLVDTGFIDTHIKELMLKDKDFIFGIDAGGKIVNHLKKNDYFALLPKTYVEKEIENKELCEVKIEDYKFPSIEYYVIYSKEIDSLTELEKYILEKFK